MAPYFLLLYVITNEKTLKLTQIDRLLAASQIFPAETHSNNSGPDGLTELGLLVRPPWLATPQSSE